MVNATLNERDEKIVASIINPDSMLLGPASPSSAALDKLTERLKHDRSEFEPKAVGKALFYIAKAVQPEEAANAIATIANSEEVETSVRQEAVSALGLLPPEYADRPLAQALKEGSPIKKSIVFKALARAGDKSSLEAIKALPISTNDRLEKLRAYAETMIALRLGETIPAEVARRTLPRITPFKINEEKIESLKETINVIEGKPFGLDFNEELGFSFECSNCKHTILFNADIKRGVLLDAVVRPQIAGIIVMEDKDRRRQVLRHSILLRPGKTTTNVSVLRTNGDVAMSGELRRDGDNLALYLRDFGNEVRPIQVSGTITNDNIDISAEIFSSVAKVKLAGIPIN